MEGMRWFLSNQDSFSNHKKLNRTINSLPHELFCQPDLSCITLLVMKSLQDVILKVRKDQDDWKPLLKIFLLMLKKPQLPEKIQTYQDFSTNCVRLCVEVQTCVYLCLQIIKTLHLFSLFSLNSDRLKKGESPGSNLPRGPVWNQCFPLGHRTIELKKQ